jgi:hypothetical protein
LHVSGKREWNYRVSNVLQIEFHKTTGKISATGPAVSEAIATTISISISILGLPLNCVSF